MPGQDTVPSFEHAFIASAQDAIIGLDLQGNVVCWNAAATRLYGFTPEETVGKSSDAWLTKETGLIAANLWETVRTSGQPGYVETHRIRKDGTCLDLVINAAPVLDPATGRLIGVSDISRAHRTEQESHRLIAEAAEKLRDSGREITDLKAALDEHAIVAITDAQGRIIFVNDKFCAISRYSREELLGKDHRIINSGHHPKEFFKNLWGTITQGKVWKGEIKNRAKDGSYYWVDTTIVPFLNAQGKPRQYVAIRAEITERKLAEQNLRERTEELARSNKELEQFAYVASHDLQEPLRAVAGCVQILQRRYQSLLDERGNELVHHAVEGATRMRGLIDDLLTFSRVGTRGGRFQAVSAQAGLDNALQNLTVAIQETGSIITHDELPMVWADLTQLSQLFQNLVGNALKFRREEPPRVHIGVAPEGRAWRFSVKDNGIGIEQEYFERLFGIFQRLHTRREYPGSGIGLAICKRIVERHGGRIWVESTPGVGTTFLFTLLAPP